MEPALVKEQVLKTAVEVTSLLVRVDDVMRIKPVMNTQAHSDGSKHSHSGGDKKTWPRLWQVGNTTTTHASILLINKENIQYISSFGWCY